MIAGLPLHRETGRHTASRGTAACGVAVTPSGPSGRAARIRGPHKSPAAGALYDPLSFTGATPSRSPSVPRVPGVHGCRYPPTSRAVLRQRAQRHARLVSAAANPPYPLQPARLPLRRHNRPRRSPRRGQTPRRTEPAPRSATSPGAAPVGEPAPGPPPNPPAPAPAMSGDVSDRGITRSAKRDIVVTSDSRSTRGRRPCSPASTVAGHFSGHCLAFFRGVRQVDGRPGVRTPRPTATRHGRVDQRPDLGSVCYVPDQHSGLHDSCISPVAPTPCNAPGGLRLPPLSGLTPKWAQSASRATTRGGGAVAAAADFSTPAEGDLQRASGRTGPRRGEVLPYRGLGATTSRSRSTVSAICTIRPSVHRSRSRSLELDLRVYHPAPMPNARRPPKITSTLEVILARAGAPVQGRSRPSARAGSAGASARRKRRQALEDRLAGGDSRTLWKWSETRSSEPTPPRRPP